MTKYIPVNKEYSIESYSPSWANRFLCIQEILQEIFKDKALLIEHVGSTSIVGMKAKPVIDVLVVVYSTNDLEECTRKMEKLDYLYRKDYVKENSIFFCKNIGGKRLENIHIFPKGHPHTSEMLNMRDYLVSHPEEAKRYESLKLELAAKYPGDYVSYRKGKDEYLNNELRRKVLQWKGKA